MSDLFLYLLPPEAWLLGILIGGILIIVGFRKAGMTLVIGIILMAILSPFIDALISILPGWVVMIMMIFFFISLARAFLGDRIADHVIGRLIYDIIILPFRLLGWLIRPARRRY